MTDGAVPILILLVPESTSSSQSTKRQSDGLFFEGNSSSSTNLLHLYEQVKTFCCGFIYLSKHCAFSIVELLPTCISRHLFLHLVIQSNIFLLLLAYLHPARLGWFPWKYTSCAPANQRHASTVPFTLLPPITHTFSPSNAVASRTD